MPDGSNIGTAFGALASGLGKAYAAKKQREHDDEVRNVGLVTALVSGGLQSGTLKNPNEAFQWLMSQFGGSKGKKGGSGGGGGAGKDTQLPPALQSVINATQAHAPAGATDQPTSPAMGMPRVVGSGQTPAAAAAAGGAPAAPQFATADELAAQQGARALAQHTATTEADFAQKSAHVDQLMKSGMSRRDALAVVGVHLPATTPKWAPGSTAGSALPPNATDIYEQPIDPKKFYKQGTSPDGTITFVPTEAPAGRQPAQEGTFRKYIEDGIAEATAGKTSALSAAEKRTVIDRLSSEWAHAHSSMTMAEKLALAKETANYRQELGTPKPDDVVSEAQAIRLGTTDVPFVDLSSYTDAKSRNAARAAAHAAGITPVTKQQADQLGAANTALGNLHEFMATLQSKMPADAQNRPLAQITIPLNRFFQTDDDLAAAVAWNLSVLPQLRAMSITGRVPVFEYQQALNSQPKVTDTVGTATKKLAIVKGILERGAHSILDRGGKPAGAPPAGATSGTVGPFKYVVRPPTSQQPDQF